MYAAVGVLLFVADDVLDNHYEVWVERRRGWGARVQASLARAHIVSMPQTLNPNPKLANPCPCRARVCGVPGEARCAGVLALTHRTAPQMASAAREASVTRASPAVAVRR